MAINPSMHDPLGCGQEFADALRQPELRGIGVGKSHPLAVAAAAYRLARALGYCRLYGVEVEEDGILPAHVAIAAAEHQVAVLRTAQEQLERRLPAAQSTRDDRDRDSDAEAQEAESLAAGMLETRLDGWATFLAVDDAYQDCLEQGEPEEPQLRDALESLMRQTESFDERLRAEADFLSLIAETKLLENVRAFLCEEYRLHFPWWLDGTLEELAAYHEALASLDSAEGSAVQQPLMLPPAPAAVLPVDHFAPVLAAADTPETGLQNQFLRWSAPVGKGEAKFMLQVQPPLDPMQEVCIQFLEVSEALGTRVSLAGVGTEIDAQGKAWFRYAELVRAAKSQAWPTLCVGVNPEPWTLQDPLTG